MENTNYYNGKKVAIVQFARGVLIIAGIILGFSYMLGDNLNTFYFSILCILLQNILYGYTRLKTRLLFVLFHFTFFVFLMTKPLIAVLRGEEWWIIIYSEFSKHADIKKMLICMLISLLMIWLGAIIGENINVKRSNFIKRSNYTELLTHNMRYIALLIFLISGVFLLLKGYEKLLFIKEHTYLEYYTEFQTRIPYIFRLIASFTRYSFCFYLATLPEKKQAVLPCVFFIGLSVPDLIMGGRADICLNILLVFFYYCFRDLWGEGKKWLGKLEKGIIIIASPAIILFLGIYIDIRAQRTINFSTIPSAIVNFFNDQGISFSYMSAALGNMEKLPGNAHYTFGTIIDYLKYGSLGRLLGMQPLDTSNSIIRATEGNSYAHHMSYILLGDDYLNGRGIGSSYLNEIYTDYSYIGIVLFSLLIGFLLIFLVRMAKQSCWSCAILLLSFPGLIYMPRSEFIGFIDYITKMQFWFIVAVSYCSVYLLGRKFIHRVCQT